MHFSILFSVVSTLLLLSNGSDALPTRRFSTRSRLPSSKSLRPAGLPNPNSGEKLKNQSITNLKRIASGSALADYTLITPNQEGEETALSTNGNGAKIEEQASQEEIIIYEIYKGAASSNKKRMIITKRVSTATMGSGIQKRSTPESGLTSKGIPMVTLLGGSGVRYKEFNVSD